MNQFNSFYKKNQYSNHSSQIIHTQTFCTKTDLPVEISPEDRRPVFGRIIELSIETAVIESIIDFQAGERVSIEAKIESKYVVLEAKIIKSFGKTFSVAFLNIDSALEGLLIDFIYNEQTGRLRYIH